MGPRATGVFSRSKVFGRGSDVNVSDPRMSMSRGRLRSRTLASYGRCTASTRLHKKIRNAVDVLDCALLDVREVAAVACASGFRLFICGGRRRYCADRVEIRHAEAVRRRQHIYIQAVRQKERMRKVGYMQRRWGV